MPLARPRAPVAEKQRLFPASLFLIITGSTKPDVQPRTVPLRVPFPEKPAVLEERNGETEFRVKQLPKMPKDYITRLVYDRTHLSIAIVKKPLEVMGGITHREFRDRKFAEIVFCAVSSDQQKQGFTKEITLGTSAGRMLKQKETIITLRAKIRTLSKSHIIHQPPSQSANGIITPIDPLSIPAIRATGWSPDNYGCVSAGAAPRTSFQRTRAFLYQIQNHKQAWLFLNPVNKDEVPDYYNAITSMDLSTMEDKLERDLHTTRRDVVNDLKFIFSNCWRYSDDHGGVKGCGSVGVFGSMLVRIPT
ncbi:uncharacterized protein P884DRAFT_281437 [Thermothelomyces heterothallicus CBS 202.75]|uniref:uncharacterized protein n=1 Tax=Thermothelomyces heterothallicus CBS 202.75 TaxID=1149848 RepID=UPI003742A1A0